jgi:hypothetical protein
LAAIPEFAHLGPLFKSSAPVELTEAVTEYLVKCTKHIFSNYIVFQVRILKIVEIFEDNKILINYHGFSLIVQILSTISFWREFRSKWRLQMVLRLFLISHVSNWHTTSQESHIHWSKYQKIQLKVLSNDFIYLSSNS